MGNLFPPCRPRIAHGLTREYSPPLIPQEEKRGWRPSPLAIPFLALVRLEEKALSYTLVGGGGTNYGISRQMILGGLGGNRYIRTGTGGNTLRGKPLMILGGLGGKRYIRGGGRGGIKIEL
jgi:hypothetical protein